MKISFNWLKQYIDIPYTAVEVAEVLTNTGLEISKVQQLGNIPGGLQGLVVGEVMEKVQHPNADRLSLTKVDVGNGDWLTIVCGAPNVAQGQKVVVAPVGTTIYPTKGDSFKIKKAKIRGELSEGMICAEDEIGLSENHDGIMILEAERKTGTPFKELVTLTEDHVFEVDITPNRSDALSHFGVARDLAAVYSQQKEVRVEPPEIPELKKSTDDPIDITVENDEACPRYCGVTISNIKVSESPDWLKERLQAIEQKPINNVVDITNFVMHELGQPLHAFDADKIEGRKVIVRNAIKGEKFTTLDEVERELHTHDLMICNANNGMCIAGIFGGINSGVGKSTTNIFLESACFDPVTVRKTAKCHQLNTDASFRFERGVDPNITMFALKRATALIMDVCGGNLASDFMDLYPSKIEAKKVKLNYVYCDRLIGKKIERAKIRAILASLDIEIVNEKEEEIEVSIPTYRVDVTRPADVVEEILRIYGYNNIELPERMHISMSHREKPDRESLVEALANLLNGMGLTEIMSNSLSSESYYEDYPEAHKNLVKILNPLSSDLNVLRQSIVFNGLETVAYHQNRQQSNLKLFEIGNVYKSIGKENSEKQTLAIFLSGLQKPETWNNDKSKMDFSFLKGICETILDRLSLKTNIKAKSTSQEYFSSGQEWSVKKKDCVQLGELNKKILKPFDIRGNVYTAIFDLDSILGLIKSNEIKTTELPKYPMTSRDFSLVLDQNVSYKELESIAKVLGGNLLKEVNLFDVYEGDKVPEGKKSYALRYHFRNDKKTLTDEEVNELMDKIQAKYEKDLGAQLR